MNVQNRKLFVNRGARQKLSQMGGIMASSSDLLGETQKFQDGGSVFPSTEFTPQFPGDVPQGPQPIAVVAGREFFASNDGQRVVDDQGQEVRDPMVLEAVMAQVMPQSPMSTAPTGLGDPGRTQPMFIDTPSVDEGILRTQPQAPSSVRMSPDGVPITMDEDLSSVFDERLGAADAGLTNTQGFLDSFNDPFLAEQNSGLSEMRAREMSDNERLQMTGSTVPMSTPPSVLGDPGPTLPRFIDTPGTDEGILRALPQAPSSVRMSPEGVPITMDEDLSSVFDERLGAADAGITNIQEPLGNFDDPFALEQEAALSEIRARKMSDNERLQMTMPVIPEAVEEKVFPQSLDAREAGRPSGPPARSVDDQRSARINASDAEPDVVEAAPELSLPSSAPVAMADIEAVVNNPDTSTRERNSQAANAVLGTEGLGPRETVAAYEEVFNEMLGVEDKDESKEMWHNMAMIGFAIAAGESPNALQNIANGMLAGTKMMKDDRASAQEREDQIAMMSLSEANEDRRLDARLRSAEKIAGMRGGGGGGGGGPSYAASDRMFKSAYDGAMGATKMAVEDGTMTAAEASANALSIASNAFPGSQFSMGGAPTPSAPVDAGEEDMVEVSQGGNTFMVPRSQAQQ